MKKMTPAWTKEHYERFGIKEGIIETWEDGMRTHGKEGSFEWWYVDSQFTNGVKAVITFFSKTNEADCDGPAHPSAKAVITLPDGRNITKIVHEPVGSEIRASKDRCDVQICNSYLKFKDGDYALRFQEDDINLQLDMRTIVPQLRKAAGHVLYGEDEEHYFGWLAAQPTCDIKGSLEISGETYDLEGNGYHDHNWGNISMERLMNHWYWGRVTFGDYTIVSSSVVTHSDYGAKQIPGFVLIKKDRIIVPVGLDSTVVRDDMFQHEFTGKFLHNKLTFINTAEDGTKYTLVYERDHDIEEYFLYEGMEESRRKDLFQMGFDPSYVRCTGDVSLKVEKDGHVENFTSKGIWEQVHLGTNKKPL